jgi:hypothetical protein
MTSISPTTLRDSLARVAAGDDDRANALTLLFLLRAVAGEESTVVELCTHDDATLVTIDEPSTDLWIAELVPVSMRTIDAVLATAPELSISFLRFGQGDDVVVRARKPHAANAFVVHQTPFELPAVDLLVAAGLAPRRHEVTR